MGRQLACEQQTKQVIQSMASGANPKTRFSWDVIAWTQWQLLT
jgi:hypothetical protein